MITSFLCYEPAPECTRRHTYFPSPKVMVIHYIYKSFVLPFHYMVFPSQNVMVTLMVLYVLLFYCSMFFPSWELELYVSKMLSESYLFH